MNAAALRIRAATAADLDFIAASNAAMALETEGKSLADAVLRQGVGNLLKHPQYGHYLLALPPAGEGDAPVGQLMITYEWSDWRNGPFHWIQSVFVRPEWRARKVFRALHDAAEANARAAGAVGLRLYVENENQSAQAIYRHLGYAATHYQLLEKEFSR
jgi:GNAT superfamily N-acetyltransferase